MITSDNYITEMEDNPDSINKGRDFYKSVDKLREFGNYCNHGLFLKMFGKEEGERLWYCFIEDANRNIFRLFFEYLRNEQVTVLVMNLVNDIDLKKMVYGMGS